MGVEQSIQSSILKYLSFMPGHYWRNNSTGLWDSTRKRWRPSGQPPGTSDILGILPNGRFVAIEVKAPKQKPTEAQAAFLEKIKENGGLALVAYDIECVEKAFKALPGWSPSWLAAGHQSRLL